MKPGLERNAALALACALACAGAGCAPRASQPAAPIVAATQVTSAEVGEANAPTPRTGKPDRPASRPPRSESRRRGDVFGWK